VLKFGYKASAEQFGPQELLRYSVMAEESGFDSVFVSDHFQPWRHNGGHAPAVLPWLGALGASTKRVTIGTSVLTPTLRYHPAVVAQAFATLGCLFPGRVVLGVGTGESMNESPLGHEFPEPKERFARLKEAIELIRALWTNERVDFAGTYYKLRAATVYDRPDEQVPVWIAASGESAARLAGRIADGFICTSGKPRALYVETLLPAVSDGAQKAKRDAGQIERMIEVKVSFDPDAARALNDCRYWGALALPAEAKVGVEDPREMERLADELPIEKAASRFIVSSDPDQHAAEVHKYVDLGFTHLVFHAPGPDQERFLKLYSKEILPRLRAGARVPA
jgi:coenzyme F420-dependent glucose-6-phosphate dehydrogenase